MNHKAASIGCKLFRNRQVKKEYESLVLGHLNKDDLLKLDLGKIAWEYTIDKIFNNIEYDKNKIHIELKYDEFTNKFRLSCPLVEKKDDFRVFIGTDNNKGKNSITKFKLEEHLIYNNYKVTKVKLNLETGRRHQLRLHMCVLDSPIVGDGTYGIEKNLTKAIFYRMMLHSSHLNIPFSKEDIEEDDIDVYCESKF